MTEPKSGHFPWERLLASIVGCAMIWWFLRTHRDWVWAYFETLMLMKNPDPAIASVAEKSISAITTIAITGITAISAVVVWFLTGSTAVLQSMFKFSSIGNASASVSDISQAITTREDIDEKISSLEKIDSKDVDPEAFDQ